MRKLGWYAVTALVAVMILGGVLLLAANLYVQSQMVQQRIRQALTNALRMPVSIRKTTVTPWEGLRIDGLTARTESAPPAEDADASTGEQEFLRADSFRAHFALWPLLHRRLVVTLLWLDKPQLTWAQDADGRWQFPPGAGPRRHKKKSPPEAPPATPSPTIPLAPVPSPTVIASTPPPPPPPAAELPHRRPDGFTVALDRFRLRHGSADFLNAKRRSIGQFEDMNFDGRYSETRCATGTLWFDKARLPRVGLSLTRFHSAFTYDDAGNLAIDDGTATLAGGTISARCHLRTREPGTPFDAECRVEKVDLGKLLQEAGNHGQWLEGTLQGKMVCNGRSDEPESRTATGRFELIDARLKNFPLFQMLGDALHIEDLSHMQFKQAQLECALNGTTLDIGPLLLTSSDLKITAQGRYFTDADRLDLHARLMIDDAVGRQLPEVIGEQFKPCGNDQPGCRYVDFDVTGPLNNPKSNLYSRVLGDPMKGLLQQFLTPKQKTPKDKSSKHHADTPPPATPAATNGGI